MSDENRSKLIIHLETCQGSENRISDAAGDPKVVVSRREIKSRDELMPLARRMTQDETLVDHYRRVQGSDDEQLAGQFIDEIERIALAWDYDVTRADAARVTVLLMEMLTIGKAGGS